MPVIKLCLGSIGMDSVISDPCYKGAHLQRAVILYYKKMTIFSYISFVKFHGKKLRYIQICFITRSVCLFCCFTSQVNSYGHCGMVSSPDLTTLFSWASLNKQF